MRIAFIGDDGVGKSNIINALNGFPLGKNINVSAYLLIQDIDQERLAGFANGSLSSTIVFV